MPADVWIDGQDRVVKMHMTIDGSAFGGTGSGGTAELTMEISDFGVPVDVQAPPCRRHHRLLDAQRAQRLSAVVTLASRPGAVVADRRR